MRGKQKPFADLAGTSDKEGEMSLADDWENGREREESGRVGGVGSSSMNEGADSTRPEKAKGGVLHWEINGRH